MKPPIRLLTPTRIPRTGDEQKLWITDYATALPEPAFTHQTSAESELD
jgi:hypothetical protein